jgi:chromosome segregation protein
LEELAKSEQQLRAQLAALSEQLGDRKSATARIGDEMLAAVAQVEARKSELAALESELKHARALADELQWQIHEHAAAIERSGAERIELEAELSKLAEQDREAADQGRQLEVSLELLRSSAADHSRELDGRRAALKPVRAELAELEEKLSECALKRERAATLAEELARSFLEKFKVSFKSVVSEVEVALAGRDAERDGVRLGEMRAKAERVAEVNLAAASEVQELEERRALLRAEQEDLQSASRDLAQTIQRLNREARRRFAETFDGVARNFGNLLPKLLPGARGRLELEQADDSSEAGVSILVQPAGKKVKEIGLLSGGEKALAALALVFALFLLNPSPFCVLDEVDAPLDEFRLAAFTSLLQEMKACSQFIVITHSQRTMQAADQIHGVTMAQPGVSRVISLSIPQST